MATVQHGDEIKVHYTGKLTNGEIFDSSEGREPLAFTVGAGMMIPGFDAGVVGMENGSKKTIPVAAADAYGERSDEQIFEFPSENVPPDMKLEAGMQLDLRSEQGLPIPVTVLEVRPDAVILDANHFLAGKDLIFEVEVVEINGQGKSLIIMP
jgi:FKBP-type peptidyl-prolyl cis-trans isomerase 2